MTLQLWLIFIPLIIVIGSLSAWRMAKERTAHTEAWKNFANAVGGQYHEESTLKWLPPVPYVVCGAGGRKFTLKLRRTGGENSHIYTRMESGVLSPQGITFSLLSRSGGTAVIEKLVKQQGALFPGLHHAATEGVNQLIGSGNDIPTGNPRFDQNFVLRSHHEAPVGQLFQNPQLQQLLLDLPDLKFTLFEGAPEGTYRTNPAPTHTLCIELDGVVKDVEHLKGMHEVMTLALRAMQ